MNKVLIVEASESDRRLMSGLLVKHGYEPITVETMEAAKDEVEKLPPGAVIVTAMKFTGGTAQDLINWQKSEGYKFPVIAIVDNLNQSEWLDLIHSGITDVIQRPAIDKQIVETVGKHVRDIDVPTADDLLINRPSKEFQRIEREITRIASADANVIIFGESGMGKEQIAREIFRQSARTDKPLIVIEAGGAALVGEHKPGSEKSEMYNRIGGYFKKAAGGTIILKNVHLLNFDKQSVVLHILNEDHPDVRVICTAEPELLELVREKKFRPTLFYLLRQLDVNVPPLRRLKEDLPAIVDYYLMRYSQEKKEDPKHLSASAMKLLRQHSWPGNIRELEVAILLSTQHVEGMVIRADDLTICQATPIMKETLLLRDENEERRRIEDAMIQAQGIKAQADKLLGIDRKTLSYKMRNYGME